MVSLSHKSKQYLWALLKVVILAFVFLFIYKRVVETDLQTFEQFKNKTLFHLTESKWILLTCLLLVIFNWVFETYKWQLLANHTTNISFKNSLRDSLAGSTLTFITPAKTGEYGIKAAYYAKEKRSKIVLLNFIGNSIQLIVTILFGVIASFYYLFFINTPEVHTLIKITLILGLITSVLFYIFRRKKILLTNISIVYILDYVKSMRKNVKLKIVLLSILRYLTFSVCFYLFLWLFGANITIYNAIGPIFLMYFFSSLLPSFFIIDVALKGGIAAYLLSYFDVALIPVLCAALAMWLLNFALPALIGSYFVMTFNPKKAI